MTEMQSAQAALATSTTNKPDRLGLWLTLPTQLLILFIVIFPLLMEIYVSLTDWSPLQGMSWIHAWESWNWFANFTDLITDDRFWKS